ncbi:MAG: efflux RND transporter periplasmic adaptor subunit, partial [Sphingobacteriales bacterium]
MNKSSIINLLKVSAMALALQACGSSESKDKKAEVTEAPATEVISLQKGAISTSFNVPGELVAYQQVD